MNKKYLYKIFLALVVLIILFQIPEMWESSAQYQVRNKEVRKKERDLNVPEIPEIPETVEIDNIHNYKTVNMPPAHYLGGDTMVHHKCTQVYNCVFVAPDDQNFEQYDEIFIDNDVYTVIEKTSNCNSYYKDSGTYNREVKCIEFYDEEEFNESEIEVKGG